MKEFIRRNRFYLALAVICVIALAWFVCMLTVAGDKVSYVPDLEQAQTLVDETVATLPRSVAMGSKYVFSNTTVTVKDVVQAGGKQICLHCEYQTKDVSGALGDRIPEIIGQAYRFVEEETQAGKMVNATKISLKFSGAMQEALAGAESVSGKVDLYAYETDGGSFTLYLSDKAVNTISGGLLDLSKIIKDTTVAEVDGETVDIKNNNTLRTGVSDCIGLNNYNTEIPESGNAVQKWWASFKDEFSRNFIQNAQWNYLTSGLLTTLEITGLSALIGIVLGFLVAVVRCTNEMTGKLDALDKICRLYLTVIRGTPTMVQLLIIYFVILLPIGIEKFPAAVLCFGVNSGAYVAEIVRGGIMSVDHGQFEAGRSLGFGYASTMWYFIAPQAFKAVIPSLANEFITLLKESSVAFYIGVADLTQAGLKIRSITYSNFMPLIAVALIYLILVVILTKCVSLLERRLRKSDHQLHRRQH